MSHICTVCGKRHTEIRCPYCGKETDSSNQSIYQNLTYTNEYHPARDSHTYKKVPRDSGTNVLIIALTVILASVFAVIIYLMVLGLRTPSSGSNVTAAPQPYSDDIWDDDDDFYSGDELDDFYNWYFDDSWDGDWNYDNREQPDDDVLL